MSKLHETIEFIALNDGADITDGSFQEQLSEMTGWMTIATAAVALDRQPASMPQPRKTNQMSKYLKTTDSAAGDDLLDRSGRPSSDTPRTDWALHGVWYRGDHGSAIPALCRQLERENVKLREYAEHKATCWAEISNREEPSSCGL
jgi:hypothetical protein